VIRLTVPGDIRYRDVAVRVVGGACKLEDVADAEQFATEVVSAFSEAFNNLAIHGYKGSGEGTIEIAISTRDGDGAGAREMVLEIIDGGAVFDPAEYLELPEEMPERGMGLFIIRSFMDEIRYTSGPPNVLTLVKRFRRG
jgi:serine/threonine-protein kinase RsbW